jgi:two-component system response regulator YesN
MKRSYFKSRLFLKYISSYLFILLIPLVLLTVIIYNSAVRNLRSEIEQAHMNQLVQAKTIVDNLVRQLNDIATRVSYDEQLAKYRVHDPYYSRDAINALKNYKATSSLIDEMFLYFRKDPNIYSTAGMTSLNVFTDTFRFQNWTGADVIQDLNSVKYPTVRHATLVGSNALKQQSMLAFLVPITPNNPNPHGMLMYLIKESELAALIDSILGDYRGSSLIFDNNGQILASNNNQENALEPSDKQRLFRLSTGIASVSINGDPHSVVSVKSDLNGWQYVTLMPSAQFFVRVLHVRSLIFMLFSIVGIAGSITALILARKQYTPIFDLVQFANSNSKPGAPLRASGASGNELERIRTVLREYSLRADLQEPYARNSFLLMLLKYGNVQNLSPVLLKAFNIQFEKDCHFVMVIGKDELPETPVDRQHWQSVIASLSRVEIPEYAAYIHSVELPKPDQIALIVSFNRLESLAEPQHIRHLVQCLHDRIVERFHSHLVIGVGSCYSSSEHLNQSFIEACSALESRVSTGHGSITFFEKLSDSPGEASWLSKNVLLKLSQSLKQGNYNVAAQTIGEALEDLRAAGFSVKLVRCVCFDILNTILKTGLELGIDGIVRDIPRHDAFHSLEQLNRHFLNLAARICSLVEQNEKKEEHSLMDQIVEYIDSHYMDHSLSLETISCKYSISVSYFSRSFKDKMGINFVQYVWRKRIEAAIAELTTTNDPLKDIIQRVGYLDTPNFIRKFKKETGHTPGQYRKLYSNKIG